MRVREKRLDRHSRDGCTPQVTRHHASLEKLQMGRENREYICFMTMSAQSWLEANDAYTVPALG